MASIKAYEEINKIPIVSVSFVNNESDKLQPMSKVIPYEDQLSEFQEQTKRKITLPYKNDQIMPYFQIAYKSPISIVHKNCMLKYFAIGK